MRASCSTVTIYTIHVETAVTAVYVRIHSCCGLRPRSAPAEEAHPHEKMTSAGAPAFRIDQHGALSVPLHVLQMPNGRIPVPNKTTALFVEIGTNGEHPCWPPAQHLRPARVHDPP